MSQVLIDLANPFSLLLFRRVACCVNISHEFGVSVMLHRLVGQVVKASASRAEDPGFESRLRGIFSGSSQTSDFKIGNPAVTLPGAWCYRVSAGTGWPGVSTL